jgi:hypothetical protein
MALFISEHYIFANYMKGNLKRIKIYIYIYIYIFLEISFSQMKCYNKLVSNKNIAEANN